MRFEDLTLAFQALFPMQQKEQSWFLVLNVFLCFALFCSHSKLIVLSLIIIIIKVEHSN